MILFLGNRDWHDYSMVLSFDIWLIESSMSVTGFSRLDVCQYECEGCSSIKAVNCKLVSYNDKVATRLAEIIMANDHADVDRADDTTPHVELP